MAGDERIYELLLELIESVKSNPSSNYDPDAIPVGVSNRHIHLSEADLEKLFGRGYVLNKLKDLSQPGQYACKETVMLCGPKGSIENVRILGPTRKETQVEVMAGDGFRLGLKPALRLSGDLDGSSGVTIVGPKGSTMLDKGLIVAQRHIHMSLEDAKRLGVSDQDVVCVEVKGARGGYLSNVVVRATNSSALEFHVDVEEANALGIDGNTKIKINK